MKILLLVLVIMLISGCAQQYPAPQDEAGGVANITNMTNATNVTKNETGVNITIEATKNVITIKAEGELLHYQEESFWSERDFSIILESKEEFEDVEINLLSSDVERYNRRIINATILFNEKNKSTTLICDIEGAMYSANSYDFHWLLGDLPFDLYQFNISEKEFVYDGEIDGIPTTITLKFPFLVTHCHEHVWPK